MADLPDVYSWIKLIDQPTGKVIPNGYNEYDEGDVGSVIIRYVVANDSNKPTDKFTVVAAIKKDGKSLPHPVPPTIIQLQPKELWKYEYIVNKVDKGFYEAAILSDVGNFINEEDESNNKAQAKFTIFSLPK